MLRQSYFRIVSTVSIKTGEKPSVSCSTRLLLSWDLGSDDMLQRWPQVAGIMRCKAGEDGDSFQGACNKHAWFLSPLESRVLGIPGACLLPSRHMDMSVVS